VSREDVLLGASELGVELEEHIQFVIEAMRGRAEELGLAGSAAAGSAPAGTGEGGGG
jgi:hypothetical protein